MRSTCALLTATLSVLGLTAGSTQGAQTNAVTVRLVVAENVRSAEEDKGLADVLPLLKENLRFSSYRLLSKRNLQAGENAETSLGEQLSLTLTDVSGNTFMARVKRGKNVLLQTRLNLAPGRPVLVGGLPGEGSSKLIIIIHAPKR